MAKGQRRKNSPHGNMKDGTATIVPPVRSSSDPSLGEATRPGLNRSGPSGRAAKQPNAKRGTMPRWAVAGIAAAIVIVVIGAGYVAFGKSPNSPLAASTTLGYSVPDEGRNHVAEGSFIQYQHNPPSSGPHYPAPKDWGVYDQPVAPGLFVHNLEHGGVVVLYDCPSSCPNVVSQLNDAYKNFPKDKYGEVKLVVSPYHPLPNGAQVTALAWDFEYDFTKGFDENQLLAFYQQHVDHSPEDVP